ncbi:hypothetical protein C8J56DRAFT_910044 [Mycena floridula]|nr:hypothetical protein C8J56DRAFT_910044 [Mycena floridula]
MTMESSDATDPFPELPFELKCLILEEMVEMVPHRAIEFVSLSRDTRSTIERVLYRCIVLRDPSAILLFVDMLEAHWQPKALYESWVKVLCITEVLDLDTLRALLSSCSGVRKLAIFLDGHRNDDEQLDALARASRGPRPIELSCNSCWTLRSDRSDRFALPLFQNVTHLELDVFKLSDFDGTRLHVLKMLTHLSLVHTDPEAPNLDVTPIPQNLSLADSIVVCIIYSKFYYNLELHTVKDIPCTDPRLVISTSGYGYVPNKRIGNVLWRNVTHVEHFVSQWGRHTDRDFVDMWEDAEEIVQIQRRNKSELGGASR